MQQNLKQEKKIVLHLLSINSKIKWKCIYTENKKQQLQQEVKLDLTQVQAHTKWKAYKLDDSWQLEFTMCNLKASLLHNDLQQVQQSSKSTLMRSIITNSNAVKNMAAALWQRRMELIKRSVWVYWTTATSLTSSPGPQNGCSSCFSERRLEFLSKSHHDSSHRFENGAPALKCRERGVTQYAPPCRRN